MAWSEIEAHDESSLRSAAQSRASCSLSQIRLEPRCAGVLRAGFAIEVLPLPNTLSIHEVLLNGPAAPAPANTVRPASTSLRDLWRVVRRRRRFIATILGALLVAVPSLLPHRAQSVRSGCAASSCAPRRSPRSALTALRPRFPPPSFPRPSHWRPWPAFCAATSLPGA